MANSSLNTSRLVCIGKIVWLLHSLLTSMFQCRKCQDAFRMQDRGHQCLHVKEWYWPVSFRVEATLTQVQVYSRCILTRKPTRELG